MVWRVCWVGHKLFFSGSCYWLGVFEDVDFGVTAQDFDLQVRVLFERVINDSEQSQDERAAGDDKTPVRFVPIGVVAFKDVPVLAIHVLCFGPTLYGIQMIGQQLLQLFRHFLGFGRVRFRYVRCFLNTVDRIFQG